MNSEPWTGLLLSVTGMLLVFAVLALLWLLIAVLERTDRSQNQLAAHVEREQTATGGIAPDLAAAITVAVLAHRAERRREAGPEVRSHPPGSLPSRWVGVGRTRQTESWEPGRRPQ